MNNSILSWLVLASLSVFGIVACGDDGPTGPTFPDLTGSYGTTYTTTFTEPGSGQSFSSSCPGTMTVDSQNSGSFSGSFIVQEATDCDQTSGTLSGEVRTDGGLNFTITVPGADPNEFTALTGCTFVSADSQFNGTFVSGRISANLGAIVDCFIEGFGTVRLEMDLDVIATK